MNKSDERLKHVLEEWKKDVEIDQFDLTKATLDSIRAHAKYLQMLSFVRKRMSVLNKRHKELLKVKYLWYNNRLTKEEMDERGLAYDPFGGHTKPLKQDLGYWYDADPDLQALVLEIEEEKILYDTLKEIITQLTWRNQHIRNLIEWKQFEAGR